MLQLHFEEGYDNNILISIYVEEISFKFLKNSDLQYVEHHFQ